MSESTRRDGRALTWDRRVGAGRPVRRGTALFSLATALLVGGCGRDETHVPVFPVRGQVQFEGKPAPGALVVFHPLEDAGDDIRPTARVEPDGSFRLSTFDKDDGAPVGEYTVTVEWQKLVTKGADTEVGPNVIPDRYAKAETSPLKATVGEAPNELPPLQLTAK
ncbi:MAG TPA: hypothetical protein VF590_11235 [Isosphaeraceae bacterium]